MKENLTEKESISLEAPPIEILTSRLKIVRPELTLAKVLFEEINADRERLSRFLPWPPFIKAILDEENYINDIHKKWNEKKAFGWSIFTKETDEFVGNIDFHEVSTTDLHGEIGYWSVSRFEGKGFITEAVKAVESALFSAGVHRISIHCSTNNSRSAKVAQRLSYKHEGTLEQDSFIGDIWHSTHIYAKLNPLQKV